MDGRQFSTRNHERELQDFLMAKCVAVCGSPGMCEEQWRLLMALGATEIVLNPL
jgi:hypothetical protein